MTPSYLRGPGDRIVIGVVSAALLAAVAWGAYAKGVRDERYRQETLCVARQDALAAKRGYQIMRVVSTATCRGVWGDR